MVDGTPLVAVYGAQVTEQLFGQKGPYVLR
jgi:hypothetical protein